MNKCQFYLHDLNNKLSLLYGLLTLSQKGAPLSVDRIDAVKCRINEIVKNLQQEIKFEVSENIQLTLLNRDEFCHFLDSTISKLTKIYCSLSINFSSLSETWGDDHKICIEKELLYQAIENAVENAFNAQAVGIEFNLYEKQKKVVLEISDNGQGFNDIENANNEQPFPQATGMHIIRENMKRMGAKAVYTQNHQTGTTLSFHFLTA